MALAHSTESDHTTEPRRSITVRAVAIAFLLLPLNAYWLGQVEGVWHGLHMSCMSLPANNLLLLIVLIGLNWLLRRRLPDIAFSRAELLTIYSLLTVETVFLGHDNLLALMGVLPGAVWYNTPGRAWDQLFFQHLPDWMVVKDYDAVMAFYDGGQRFYGSGMESHWLRPVLGWSGLLMLLFLIHTSLGTVVAHRWTRRERLSYPIVQLPIQLTRRGAPPFLRRAFWYGFALAAIVDLVNGLSYLYPILPHFPVKEINLRQYFTAAPLRAMGTTHVRFYPFVIGMAFLMPSDVLNSCWIFYLFGKVLRVLGRLVGWSRIPRFPFAGEQAAGGMVAIVLLMLWTMRTYLRRVLLSAMGRPPTPGLRQRAGQYRFALAVMAWSLVGVVVLCGAMGMSAGMVPVFFLLYLLISVGVARIRAEVGPPSHSMLYVNPQDMLMVWRGSQGIGQQDLTLFALFWWFNRLNRNHPMPVALEAFRMSDVVRTDRDSLTALMWLMALATIAAAFLVFPALFFRDGTVKAAEVLSVGRDTFNRLNVWLTNPQPASNFGRAFMLGGLAFAILLGFMRTRFLWWSLHPMGYVLGLSYAVDFYWASLLVASACKGLLLRYGGSRTYRRALPFFIGLIIGEVVVACGWSLLALALHKPMYDAWW
ncbi:MAG: DUF6785 family protein [Armatimonadota bacterium]